jgi:hypothetical protein
MDFFSRPLDPGEDEYWGEPISVYTDASAIDDGVLVDLAPFSRVSFRGLPVNRMTRHLFDDLKPFFDSDAEGDAKEFGIALASTLRTKCSFATGDPGNSGEIGDIYRIPPKLWLVRNEVGGWTAMYPEDY